MVCGEKLMKCANERSGVLRHAQWGCEPVSDRGTWGLNLQIASAMVVTILFFLSASFVNAEDRMQVEGRTIIFNTDAVTDADDKTPGIIYADVNLFGDLVMNHTDVDTVIVSGGGGSTSAAYDIANKITEYGMSTIARNNCSSACAIIFLAGSERTLEKGARLGFHRSSTTAEDHEEYYRENKDKLGWANEFAYAVDLHQVGQISARNFVEFTARRGVSLDFILRALSYSPRDMWYPTTEELLEAGVLVARED